MIEINTAAKKEEWNRRRRIKPEEVATLINNGMLIGIIKEDGFDGSLCETLNPNHEHNVEALKKYDNENYSLRENLLEKYMFGKTFLRKDLNVIETRWYKKKSDLEDDLKILQQLQLFKELKGLHSRMTMRVPISCNTDDV